MSQQASNDDTKSNINKDFVIRDGFPALRKPDGSHWIEGDEPLPRQPFLAFEQALDFSNLDDWRHDCETVFTARDKEENVSYSAGITYFMPSVMKPRCALEAFVLALFHRHVTDQTLYLPEQSGAEWWTLVMDENEEDKKDSDDDDNEADEVGMHFDADYGLEEQAPGLLIHPRIATVTYLSEYGAPTVVFNTKSPPPNDIASLGGEVKAAWVSHPSVGKHIAFDGRLLHGAPATFFPALKGQRKSSLDEPPNKKAKSESTVKNNKKRYTILVNIWLNHCPLDAEPLDEDVIQQLKVPFDGEKSSSFSWNTSFDASSSPQKLTLDADVEDPAGEEETVICGRRVNIFYNPNMDLMHGLASSGSLLELDLGKGAVSIQVGTVQEESDGENDDSHT